MHYQLAIRNIEWGTTWRYDGQVAIYVMVREPTSRVFLLAQELHIESVRVHQPGEKDMFASHVHVTGPDLTIDFPCEIAQGAATISIVFQGVVQDAMEGFYRARHDLEAQEGQLRRH